MSYASTAQSEAVITNLTVGSSTLLQGDSTTISCTAPAASIEIYLRGASNEERLLTPTPLGKGQAGLVTLTSAETAALAPGRYSLVLVADGTTEIMRPSGEQGSSDPATITILARELADKAPMPKGPPCSIGSLPVMTRWFDPNMIFSEMVKRRGNAQTFAQFADQRMTQSAVDGYGSAAVRAAAARYDYRWTYRREMEEGGLWVDYIADMGDGFDPTYAMACLVGADSLDIPRLAGPLPASKLVILGGDEVYPAPTWEKYKNQFVFPWSMALPDKTKERRLFALAGNHDWYDGLKSFERLFCSQRYRADEKHYVGDSGWLTSQHRSYFAIRLPHNWWIWGTDLGLGHTLDLGQILYFEAAARLMRQQRLPEGLEHKVILCVSEPSWQYLDYYSTPHGDVEGASAASFDMEDDDGSLRTITRIAQQGGAKIATVLSCDSHHYCRHFSKDLGLSLITSGGGGAFLHATHQLSDTKTVPWLGKDETFTIRCKLEQGNSVPTRRRSSYPSHARSRWLTAGNFFFPLNNFTLCLGFGFFYWFMTWVFSRAIIDVPIGEGKSRTGRIQNILILDPKEWGLDGWNALWRAGDVALDTVRAGVAEPITGLLVIVLWIAMYAGPFMDAKSSRAKIILATVHWLLHLAAMVVMYILIHRLALWVQTSVQAASGLSYVGLIEGLRVPITVPLMVVLGGYVGGAVIGTYVMVNCIFFNRNFNEGFSGLRNADYKNFLRLKIEPERLTIYPIGLRKTPRRSSWLGLRSGWRWDLEATPPRIVPTSPLKPELIEGPIVVEVAEVRQHTGRVA